MIELKEYLLISAILFIIGLMIIITKRNSIFILIGIELILNAANLNFVAFSKYDPVQLQGQVFSLFIIIIAAAEAAVGLAIILKVYSYFRTANVDEIDDLKG
ncbi:MAG TPA: NADH-quinone oxidoreductase subunit NuoK [Cytophagaceae bacterium]